MKFFTWMRKMGTGFIGWVKLAFADDDAHHIPGAPAMRNIVLFMLAVSFVIGFLKVVYLMEVVVHHDIKTDKNVNMQFKSFDPKTINQQIDIQELQKQIAALQEALQADQQTTQTFSVPDIPSGWQTVLLGGIGVFGAVSASKKISEMKYLGGNGNGNGKDDDKDKPQGGV